MSRILLLSAVALLLGGCHELNTGPDLTPPAPPRGLISDAGDGWVDLFWTPNAEPDLAGYDIYVSTSFNGSYHRIGSTRGTAFTDNGVTNGITYYYAVAAYDFSGNVSDLSYDITFDTPRPEGHGVVISDAGSDPANAGYDFSALAIRAYNDPLTDLFYDVSTGGTAYLDVWTDSDIQDAGVTSSIADVHVAPTTGWSPTKDVLAIPGHTYIIRTWDNHYAKVRVSAVSLSGVQFDWAYQLQTNNTQLKPTAVRGPLHRTAGISTGGGR